MANKKETTYKHTITITFDTSKKISSKVEGDVLGAIEAQLEGLSEDHDISYQNTDIDANLNIK